MLAGLQKAHASQCTSLLLIERSIVDQVLIEEMLEGVLMRSEVRCVSGVEEGLKALKVGGFDCVLVASDLGEDEDGLRFIAALTLGEGEVRAVPTIVLAPPAQESRAPEAIRIGAQDFLIKGEFTPRILQRSIIYAIERFRLSACLHKDKSALRRKVRDLSEAHTTLSNLVVKDALTKLNNRRGFDQQLNRLIAEAKRGRPLCLVMVDIDHFKHYNDTHGHPAGDHLLARFGALLKAQARAGDCVARYGGEEFAILMADVREKGAAMVAERIRGAVESHFEAQGVTASFGVSEFTSEMGVGGALVEAADRALYEAKAGGRNRVVSRSIVRSTRQILQRIRPLLSSNQQLARLSASLTGV